MIDFRLSAVGRDRHPDLPGILCCQSMISQGREKADDTAGNAQARFRQTVVFGGLRIGDRVDAAPGSHQQTCIDEALQMVPGKANRVEVSCAQNALASGEPENLVGRNRCVGNRHVYVLSVIIVMHRRIVQVFSRLFFRASWL